MKLFVTILTILTFKVALSQKTPASLMAKAFDFSYKENKLDSALKCYQDLRQLYPNYREAYILYQIANSFLKIGDSAQAEHNYLKSMQVDNKQDSLEFGFGQSYSCAKLANLYYRQKRFREALIYMDYTKKEFKSLRTLCQGGYGQTNRLQFQYKKAVCYFGLNKKDSSIISLAPFIFKAIDYYYLDSLEYNSISNFFISTVFELYDKCETKTQMIEALNKIDYVQTIKDEPGRMYRWVAVDCSILFLGIKINLDDGSSYGLTKDDSIPDYISKDFLLKEFTESPSYKMIME